MLKLQSDQFNYEGNSQICHILGNLQFLIRNLQYSSIVANRIDPK